MSGEDHSDHDHELAMPFVIVTSVGGPFDDAAFVAGWQCAQIDETLTHSGASWSGYVHHELLPQLDLLAMKRQLVVHQTPPDEDAPAWVFVTIASPPAEPEEQQ